MIHCISEGLAGVMISITPLLNSAASNTSSFTGQISSMNQSMLTDYKQLIRKYAEVRELIIKAMSNTTSDNPAETLLEAMTLAEITSATNQLTRDAAVRSRSESPLNIDSQFIVDHGFVEMSYSSKII